MPRQHVVTVARRKGQVSESTRDLGWGAHAYLNRLAGRWSSLAVAAATGQQGGNGGQEQRRTRGRRHGTAADHRGVIKAGADRVARRRHEQLVRPSSSSNSSTIAAPGSRTTGGGAGTGGADASNCLECDCTANPYSPGSDVEPNHGAAPGGFGTPSYGDNRRRGRPRRWRVAHWRARWARRTGGSAAWAARRARRTRAGRRPRSAAGADRVPGGPRFDVSPLPTVAAPGRHRAAWSARMRELARSPARPTVQAITNGNIVTLRGNGEGHGGGQTHRGHDATHPRRPQRPERTDVPREANWVPMR